MREFIRAPEFSSKSSAAAIKGYLGSRLCFCSMTPHLRMQARILSPIASAAAQKLSRKAITAEQNWHGRAAFGRADDAVTPPCPFGQSLFHHLARRGIFLSGISIHT